jgi:hypothetical protein
LGELVKKQPSDRDRALSHVVVAIAVGLIVGKKFGKWGFVVGALVGAEAHEILDAPVAQVIADYGP